ncbi:hypothetical protein BsIDN1_46830 [Bacillus safensis]|uniref:Major facilitator superfamily (MFS) profile domain-containing protein n=1 Tax=Bacillus safensis TaxID=561879 RepID=A0A5S9MDU7_BACIA|nr:hypothetical protein BsIDN1_46830 [Bacillus safensis]
MLKEDAKLVLRFSLTSRQIMTVYLLFSAAISVLPTAIDSLETAFAKEVLMLTDTQYGLLVSIAGAGIIAGASLNSVIVERLSVSLMLGIGSLFVAFGYLIYAFSSSLVAAAGGFFISLLFSICEYRFYDVLSNKYPRRGDGEGSQLFMLWLKPF